MDRLDRHKGMLGVPAGKHYRVIGGSRLLLTFTSGRSKNVLSEDSLLFNKGNSPGPYLKYSNIPQIFWLFGLFELSVLGSSHLISLLTSLFGGQRIEIIQYIAASHVINFKGWKILIKRIGFLHLG